MAINLLHCKATKPPFSNLYHVTHNPSSSHTSGEINPEVLLMSIELTRRLLMLQCGLKPLNGSYC
jgi:hypothetical protein